MTTMLGAIVIDGVIGLGSILLGCLIALATLVGIIRGTKWKTAYEVESAAADGLRESLKDSLERGERLERALERAREDAKRAADAAAAAAKEGADRLAEAVATIARLESLPNLARVIETIDSHEQRAEARYESTELRSQERHDKSVHVLDVLLERVTDIATTNGEVHP